MKTLSTLPTIPEGWAWAKGVAGWLPVSPLIAMSLQRLTGLAPTFGTPPAGSTVWDPQALDWVRYQPEGA